MAWTWILLVFVIAVSIIGIILYGVDSKRQQKVPEAELVSNKPKIGAEVSISLYDEIKLYCSKHSMSISDLIRSAVRTYMDMYE